MTITKTVQYINSKTALHLVLLAVEKANEMGVDISVCVVDGAGFVIAQWCTDNARFQTKEWAYNKAFTAAAMQADTSDWYNKIRDNPQVCQGIANRDSKFMVLPGGVVLSHNGAFIGAMGISGGSPDQDIKIAQHAIAHSGI